MIDTFSDHSSDISAPPSNAVQITPSDTADLSYLTRAIYVGIQGDLRILTHNNQEVIYKNILGIKVIRAKRVFATGTTAGALIAEW